MKRNLHVWLLICSICFVVSCSDGFRFSPEPNSLSEMKCYKTFEEFAYTDFLPSTEKWLPTEPWQIQTTMPNEYDGGNVFWDVELVRYVNGIPEIWLTSWENYKDEIPRILIYYPESDDWIPISTQVEESDVLVWELYLTSDDSILGKNYWFSDEQGNPSIQWTILSKYNEQTNQFEFVSDAPLISDFNGEDPARIDALFDDVNNTFWMVIDDELYAYESSTNKTTKQADLQDIAIGTLASATDGTIYFTNVINEPEQPVSDPELYEGLLMQFSPKSGEFIELDIPDEPWPGVGLPIITKSDKLWIGSIGYLDLTENYWNLLVDPFDYYVGGYISWPPAPQVIIEDESGVVWFRASSETRGAGMAWYDPETGGGCMFTNSLANIVEDERQNLWMFTDGQLYRLSREN